MLQLSRTDLSVLPIRRPRLASAASPLCVRGRVDAARPPRLPLLELLSLKARQRLGLRRQDAEQLIELGDHEDFEDLRLDVGQPQLAVLLPHAVVYVDQRPQ